MRRQSLDFLKALVSTPSPSGFEQAAQKLCADYMSRHVDKVYKDVHGNQFAVRNPDAPFRVMLDAHVDEVGLMVNHIDDDGFIRFVAIGGVDPVPMSCQRVVIQGRKGPVSGVIGQRPPHLTPEEERGKPARMHEMWIDIAARNRKEAEKLVAVGDPVTVDVGYVQLCGDRVTARGLDDKLGAFVIIEVMRRLAKRKLDIALYCVTTVQEEIGSRGATTSAYQVNPHVALAVEFGWTTDHPSVDVKEHGKRCLGKGPLISRGPNISPVIERLLLDTAGNKGIPYQVVPEPRGTPTDARVLQLARGGVATGLVRVPGRYLHSPVEVVSLADVEHTIALIEQWVCNLSPDMDLVT